MAAVKRAVLALTQDLRHKPRRISPDKDLLPELAPAGVRTRTLTVAGALRQPVRRWRRSKSGDSNAGGADYFKLLQGGLLTSNHD